MGYLWTTLGMGAGESRHTHTSANTGAYKRAWAQALMNEHEWRHIQMGMNECKHRHVWMSVSAGTYEQACMQVCTNRCECRCIQCRWVRGSAGMDKWDGAWVQGQVSVTAPSICSTIHEGPPQTHRSCCKPVYHLSSSNGWTNWTNEPSGHPPTALPPANFCFPAPALPVNFSHSPAAPCEVISGQT